MNKRYYQFKINCINDEVQGINNYLCYEEDEEKRLGAYEELERLDNELKKDI